jgi:hypothetical protein
MMSQGRRDGKDMLHAWVRTGAHVKSDGKRSLGIPRRGTEDNINMDLRNEFVVLPGFIWRNIRTSGELM